MNGDLVVIFVRDREETEKYLDPMGFIDLGDDGRNVALIAADRFLFMSENADIQDVDIILLPDGDLTDESEEGRALKRYNDLKNRVLVAYHSGSEHRETQAGVMSRVFGNRLVSYIDVHSDSGSVYDLLMEIAECRASKNKGLYQNALERLIALFPYNLELDARLELLHLCLTPESAALIHGQRLPEHIPSSVREKISELTKIDINGRTIGDMIKDLADRNADPFDESEGGYIKKLEAIRSVLLPDAVPGEESPDRSGS